MFGCQATETVNSVVHLLTAPKPQRTNKRRAMGTEITAFGMFYLPFQSIYTFCKTRKDPNETENYKESACACGGRMCPMRDHSFLNEERERENSEQWHFSPSDPIAVEKKFTVIYQHENSNP